jgi:hypothetical protein
MAGNACCRVCAKFAAPASCETIDAGPVCVNCSGTDADVKEAISRASEQLSMLTGYRISCAVRIAKGAQLRRRVRLGLIPRPANRKSSA